MRKRLNRILGENKTNQSQSFDDSTALIAGFAQDRFRPTCCDGRSTASQEGLPAVPSAGSAFSAEVATKAGLWRAEHFHPSQPAFAETLRAGRCYGERAGQAGFFHLQL